MIKKERLEIRCKKHIKQIIKEAAKIKGTTISEFVINSAIEEALFVIDALAEKTLQDIKIVDKII